MRTIIDLPQRELRYLSEMAEERGMSRAELIRQAIAVFLRFHEKAADGAFGLWKEGSPDGLRYQQAVRAEWEQ